MLRGEDTENTRAKAKQVAVDTVTKVSEGLIRSWWTQGMMSGHKNAYDCIKAFSETDFTEDLKAIDVPVLVMHGEDDQIVPIADSALLAIKLLRNGTLKVYKGLPHGMCTTHPDIINADLLDFIGAPETAERPFILATPNVE